MTVVVGFLCTDGAVIAADSMLTPSMGNIQTGHHNGRKVFPVGDDQLCAYAGDQGQAQRFLLYAKLREDFLKTASLPYDVAKLLSNVVLGDLAQTKIGVERVAVNTLLAFRLLGSVHLAGFLGPLQPNLLDEEHFYVALGSGKQMADPFLAFLLDTFSPSQPTMREAVFLATWVLDHVIRTNPGGVAGPIRIGILPTNLAQGNARELNSEEIEEQRQAIAGATDLLRAWRDTLSGISPASANSSMPPLPGPANQ